MNTPAHATVSLLLWSHEPGWAAASAVMIGAWLPDIPIFAFFGYHRACGVDRRTIWSTYYYLPEWQLLFDIFHTFVLILAIAALSYFLGSTTGFLLAASALLHLCGDLPFHHEDAHRHFLPFSPWQFFSPVSYWDPNRFGRIFFGLECTFVCIAGSYLVWTNPHMPMRFFAGANGVLYLLNTVRSRLKW
jgi:hypothetical protein